jgi:hypothetical protein
MLGFCAQSGHDAAKLDRSLLILDTVAQATNQPCRSDVHRTTDYRQSHKKDQKPKYYSALQ